MRKVNLARLQPSEALSVRLVEVSKPSILLDLDDDEDELEQGWKIAGGEGDEEGVKREDAWLEICLKQALGTFPSSFLLSQLSKPLPPTFRAETPPLPFPSEISRPEIPHTLNNPHYRSPFLNPLLQTSGGQRLRPRFSNCRGAERSDECARGDGSEGC